MIKYDVSANALNGYFSASKIDASMGAPLLCLQIWKHNKGEWQALFFDIPIKNHYPITFESETLNKLLVI